MVIPYRFFYGLNQSQGNNFLHSEVFKIPVQMKPKRCAFFLKIDAFLSC